jgi:hypothetical protein
MTVTSKVPPPERQGRGRRLGQQPEHLQARQFTRPARGGPHGVVEIGGHRDDGLADRPGQQPRVLGQLAEDEGGDVLGPVGHPGMVERPGGAHVALDQLDR